MSCYAKQQVSNKDKRSPAFPLPVLLHGPGSGPQGTRKDKHSQTELIGRYNWVNIDSKYSRGEYMFLRTQVQVSWREGSAVKSMYCSCRRPRFNSQNSQGSFQLPVTWVPGGQTPSQTYMQGNTNKSLKETLQSERLVGSIFLYCFLVYFIIFKGFVILCVCVCTCIMDVQVLKETRGR